MMLKGLYNVRKKHSPVDLAVLVFLCVHARAVHLKLSVPWCSTNVFKETTKTSATTTAVGMDYLFGGLFFHSSFAA